METNGSEVCTRTDPAAIEYMRERNDHRLYVALAVFDLSISPFIVVENALVIASVYFFKCLRSDFKLIMVNLAVADLVVGLLPLPQHAIGYLYPWLLICNWNFCWSYGFGLMFMSASLYFLLVIAVDRIQALVYPFSYHNQRMVRYRMIATVWILTLLPIFLFGVGGFRAQTCLV